MCVGREEIAMSQANVERLIGRLMTDEAFRHRFATDPSSTLESLAMEFNSCETQALLAMNLRALRRCTDAIDPRLQKSDLQKSDLPKSNRQKTELRGGAR
jgi:putative modified peptide